VRQVTLSCHSVGIFFDSSTWLGIEKDASSMTRYLEGVLLKAKKPRQNHYGQNNCSKSFYSFAPNGFAF
jgi:hypothetical protein